MLDSFRLISGVTKREDEKVAKIEVNLEKLDLAGTSWRATVVKAPAHFSVLSIALEKSDGSYADFAAFKELRAEGDTEYLTVPTPPSGTEVWVWEWPDPTTRVSNMITT